MKELNVLSQSQTPPFTIEDNTDGGDDILSLIHIYGREVATGKEVDLNRVTRSMLISGAYGIRCV